MKEYTKLQDILKNKYNNAIKTYQIQSDKDNDYVDIIYIGDYENIPIVQIMKPFDVDGYNCSLISFMISEDELDDSNELSMIGFIITQNEVIVKSLMFTFIPDCKTKKIKKVNGVFNIIYNDYGTQTKKLIKEYKKYVGKEESIYILTSLLVEENVCQL